MQYTRPNPSTRRRFILYFVLGLSILGLALGLGLGLWLKKKSEPARLVNYELTVGEWAIDRTPLGSAAGTCANESTVYGDGGELWSTCGKVFEAKYQVSQYPNGSYALAGGFPIPFDNALGFSPSDTASVYYQFPVKFFTESGNCEIEFQLIAKLGSSKDRFEFTTLAKNPVQCSVEGLSVPAGYTCTCTYRDKR